MNGDSGNSDPRGYEQTFTHERLADIDRLKATFDRVYPQTIEQWVCTFIRTENPHKELNWWLSFAELFHEYTVGMSLDECMHVFKGMYLMSVDTASVSQK